MSRMNVKQRKREVQCALNLVKMVEPYVRGDVEAFQQACTAEALELVQVSFGACLLYVLAEIYQFRAAEFLGYQRSPLGWNGHIAAWKGKKISFDNHTAAAGAGIRAAGAAIRTYRMVKEIADKSGEGSTSDPISGMSATQLRATQDSLPVFLEAMWHVSVLDIERTITAVTHKLCRDHSVDMGERNKRAEALAMMGDIFMAAARDKGGSKDPKQKVAEMVAIMVPAATGAAAPATANESAGSRGVAGENGSDGERKCDGFEPSSRASSSRAAASPPLTADELRRLKPSELKRRLREHGIINPEAVEKEELVQMVLMAQMG